MMRATRWLCLVTLSFLIVYDIFLPLSPDEAYYWDWSRHLALSYYDGPPMTAYLIRLFTDFFGTSAFVVKLVSIVCCLLTGLMTYCFAYRLFGLAVAEKTVVLLLFMPLSQVGFMVTTLDTPLCLFWIACLYSFYLALTDRKVRYFYLAGFLAGCMLLSKYTGILLLAALFFYVVSFRRDAFKNIHLYLANVLALVIFSPVLIWNIQHHWLSFAFQWRHGVSMAPVFSWTLLAQFVGSQMGVYNPIFFLTLIFLGIKYRTVIRKNQALLYLLYSFLIPWLFFCYNACFQQGEANWPAPAYFGVTIVLAYLIQLEQCIKTYVIAICLAINVILFLKLPWLYAFANDKHIFVVPNNFFGYSEMMKEAGTVYPNKAILFGAYPRDMAEAAFYLPTQPTIYQLPPRVSQYTLQSQLVISHIRTGQVPEVWYIGSQYMDISFLQSHFKHCTIKKTINYHGTFNNRTMIVGQCVGVIFRNRSILLS